MIIEDIRRAFRIHYLDVDNDEFTLQASGYVHENPMTAIGVVLISAVVLGTTDIDELSTFTRYSKRFIQIIASNMENSGLWKDGKYDSTGWSSGNLFPRNECEEREFWEQIWIAEGSVQANDAKSSNTEDPGIVFWNMKKGLSHCCAKGRAWSRFSPTRAVNKCATNNQRRPSGD